MSQFTSSDSQQKVDSFQTVTVVSGLPRSGTSMMMSILQAGGYDLLTDGIRSADTDNPKGYFEFEEVKGLVRGDDRCVSQAQGKAVKIISPLLRYLPKEFSYSIVIMRRKMEEILSSQKVMLRHRGESDRVEDSKLADLYEKDLRAIDRWMSSRSNVRGLHVSYNSLMENPKPELERLVEFLGANLDIEAMAEVIEPDLYRQRR